MFGVTFYGSALCTTSGPCAKLKNVFCDMERSCLLYNGMLFFFCRRRKPMRFLSRFDTYIPEDESSFGDMPDKTCERE